MNANRLLHDRPSLLQNQIHRYIGIGADITKQKEAEAVIWQQANHDLLTHLPNRHRLHELLQQMLEKSRRDGLTLAVLHVDLDHFGQVNETLGHGIGDQLIVEAGRRISACLGLDADRVAHLGRDKFVVVLGALADAARRVEQVAGDILRTMSLSDSTYRCRHRRGGPQSHAGGKTLEIRS